jgi:hypothetical protein
MAGGRYIYPIRRDYLNLSGGTVSGDTYFSGNLSANTIFISGQTLSNILNDIASGDTVVNGGTNINVTGTGIEPIVNLNDDISLNSVYLSGSTTANTFVVKESIEPQNDSFVDIGSIFRKFRNIFVSNANVDKFTGNTVVVTETIEPTEDNEVSIGTPIKRFREFNVVNGVAVGFTASTLNLGGRTLTEFNVILSGDTIDGGLWP